MVRRFLCVVLLLAAWGCSKPAASPTGAVSAVYIDSRSCESCHAEIARTYRETAMAKAFSRATAGAMRGALGTYQHPASGRSYAIVERDGRYFQRREAKGFEGVADYQIEREIHYVMGSGNHVRTFIHRTPQGRLTELPVSWYAENGGTLAMSPGYDTPAPLEFRRKISFDCMFCHNAYPGIPPGKDAPALEPVFPTSLPDGIDCQRCHGPGSLHVAEAGQGKAPAQRLRDTIVNPGRLSPERSMEVCMQCHLETTSFPLPNALVRFGRGAFSYRPGEPLGDFTLHFDHAKGSGREEKFEIVNSAYRLRQSQCFLASEGKLGCTTCHNPHQTLRGDAARDAYSNACRSCHQSLAGGPHKPGADCASCHMPKRRTEDVIHAVMTDHKIVRRPPPGNLLAPRKEIAHDGYSGEVELYYPPAAKDQEVYLAVAQVIQRSNLKGGIPRLEAVIRSQKPKEPRVYFTLAQGYEKTEQPALAEAQYKAALEQDPSFVPAMLLYGEFLHRQGRAQQALEILEKGRSLEPQNSGVHYALGLVYRDLGRARDAVAALEAAIGNDSDFPEAHNSLGGVLMELGDRTRAEAAFREALRQQPDLAEAQSNLGYCLAIGGDYPRAEFHLTASLALKPGLLQAWQALGDVQSARGQWGLAKKSYGEVLRKRPQDPAANLGIGTAQAASGEFAAARASLNRAAASANPAIRQEAMDLLNQMPR